MLGFGNSAETDLLNPTPYVLSSIGFTTPKDIVIDSFVIELIAEAVIVVMESRTLYAALYTYDPVARVFVPLGVEVTVDFELRPYDPGEVVIGLAAGLSVPVPAGTKILYAVYFVDPTLGNCWIGAASGGIGFH